MLQRLTDGINPGGQMAADQQIPHTPGRAAASVPLRALGSKALVARGTWASLN
jgi:hypothetical protein